MNHGAPAATTARSGKSGSKMRRAPRSSALRATTVRRPSWSVSSIGTLRRHWAIRSAGLARSTGWPHSQRGSISSPSMRAGELLADRPLAPGRDDDLERGQVGVEAGRRRERDAQAPARASRGGAGRSVAAVDVLAACSPSGARDGPALLDLEQVGEVGVVGQLDGAVRRLVAEVADDQVLAHAPPDVAVADDHQGRVGPARTGPDPAHEGGRERLGRAPWPALRGLAVDPELEPGKEPGVAEEEALGRPGRHVAVGRGDGEGRPLDQGDPRHRVPARPRGPTRRRTSTASVTASARLLRTARDDARPISPTAVVVIG